MMLSVLTLRTPRAAEQSISAMCAVYWRLKVISSSAPVTGQNLNSSLSLKTVSISSCCGNTELI